MPEVEVTILMSAQFLNVSGRPHPTASVPFAQVPHMLPEETKIMSVSGNFPQC